MMATLNTPPHSYQEEAAVLRPIKHAACFMSVMPAHFHCVQCTHVCHVADSNCVEKVADLRCINTALN